jgi:hypothetical protein
MIRDIKGYEGYYSVTDDGQVFSNSRVLCDGRKVKSKWLKIGHNNLGYPRVTLSKDRKTERIFVHRIVAEQFIPNPENKPCINHKDGNKQNNHFSNLEWCTVSENTQHAWDNELITSRKRGMKTHCPSGHDFTSENTYLYKGYKLCKQCKNEKQSERRSK